MYINLLTDAPQHNLALMKISGYHKGRGDIVNGLNMSLMPADKTYASWLFDWSPKYHADMVGGPAEDLTVRLPKDIYESKPDYDLFPNIDYSLGHTFEWCPRKCDFCKVPKMNMSREHRSIWTFHDKKFSKICLLNNNTFADPRWRETFQEVWDAKLMMIEHGFDIRLLNDKKAEALKRTRFAKQIHFAWDDIKDERSITKGLKSAMEYKLASMVYVLVGYNSTPEEDIHRCQVIHDHKQDPYPMVFTKNPHTAKLRNVILGRFYRSWPSIKDAYDHFDPKNKDVHRIIKGELGSTADML